MATLSSPARPHALSASPIERYFELSLYLLLVTGFATLAATGRLDPASLLFVALAFIVRGWMLARARDHRIPERWTNYITLLYVVFYGLDFLFLSGSFVTATVHLVLFSMVVKVFSVQRDRDHMYLAVLAFLEVLAAAVLTVDSSFLFALVIFVLLAITTFSSMEMKRSAARAVQAAPAVSRGPREREVGWRHRLRRLPMALSLTSVALVLAIVLVSPLLFFLLPRISAGYLGAFAPRNELVSGFGNDVNLGEIGAIQQSSTVVMHVTFEGDHPAPEAIKWRGTSLHSFDGKRWTATPSATQVWRTMDGRIDVAHGLVRVGEERPRGYHALRYRVLMEPVGIDVFFLPPVPEVLLGNYRAVIVDEGGAVFNSDRDHQITAYVGLSNIAVPPPDELRRATGELPPRIALRYLQLPRLDHRIPTLAQQVTAAARSPYEQAVALENYLRTRYGYTLQLPSAPVDDPLANFLFVRREGHCEYFASAMAVMLRSLGIPSRMVNGFRTGEFNDVTGSYIVRARDAHSWVEAYFPGQGWVAFDPTPASLQPVFKSGWARVLLYVDAMREFWREWIINYDFAHQRTLTTSFATQTRQWVEARRMAVRRQYFRLLAEADRIRNQAARQPGKWSFVAVSGAALLLLLINLRRLYRAWQRHRLVRAPERAPTVAAGLWYQRLTRWLARHGWPKLPTQAPREYLASIEDRDLRRRVASFTDSYERARFGASPDAAKELPERYAEIVRR